MTLLLTVKVDDLTEVSSATATGEIRKHSHLGWSRKVLPGKLLLPCGGDKIRQWERERAE